MRRYKLLPLCFLLVGVGAVVALALSAGGMSATKLEIILFLIGIGFGPTAPLTQVAMLNTVPAHDLGAAIGTMNFARTLVGTILVAAFSAVVLADAPVGAEPGAREPAFPGGGLGGELYHRFPRHRCYACGGLPGGDPARGKAASRTRLCD